MAATLKLGREPSVYNGFTHFETNQACTHSQHVGVVVVARELGRQGLLAERTANTLDLIGGDAYANTAEIGRAHV